MNLTKEEERMLSGEEGYAAMKSMQIIVALGEILGADRLIHVRSVHVAGVSYRNLGDAGLEFLNELARDGRARVKSTLNPGGMDLKDWGRLGIRDDFAEKQLKVIEAYGRLGIKATCTCTPYLVGSRPKFGDHISWSESSAVVFANSVLGARTNREGAPAALASSITGRTALYGLHLEENRAPTIEIDVGVELKSEAEFAALGYFTGALVKNGTPLFRGIRQAGDDSLKILSAALATSGGVALFHMDKVTPEATLNPYSCKEKVSFTERELKETMTKLDDGGEPDFICIGCPHCSVEEVERAASVLKGKQVSKEVWICCSRKTADICTRRGLKDTIEASGAKLVSDTCMVVAPVNELGFSMIASNSSKACHYSRNMSNLRVRLASLESCLSMAVDKK